MKNYIKNQNDIKKIRDKIIRDKIIPLLLLTLSFIWLMVGCIHTLNKSIKDGMNAISKQFGCVPIDTSREVAHVIKIIDGDSILVKIDNQLYEVRYIGINTPEFDSPEESKAQAAALLNKELVDNRTILLIRDVRNTDKFGRLLRFVFTDDSFVNYKLVRQGAAIAKEYPPDISCQILFQRAQRERISQ